jgi:hypothetical protein
MTEPYPLDKSQKNLFFKEVVHHLADGTSYRALEPFEGEITTEPFGFYSANVENPYMSGVAYANPRGKRPFRVGVVPFQQENIENLKDANRASLPAPEFEASELRAIPSLRTLSRASDPHSVALSRSSSVESGVPLFTNERPSAKPLPRRVYPRTYVLVNLNKKRPTVKKPSKKPNSKGNVKASSKKAWNPFGYTKFENP